jgi:DNA repair protein RadC
VTRNGKPVAVLLTVENDVQLERLLLAHSKRFRAILEASWQQIEERHGIGHEAFWQEIEAGSEPRPAEAATPENTRI